MLRHQLTDEQWELISDLFPAPKRTGRPPSPTRQMIDGIFWILNTGAQWRDLPETFGPKSTVWGHFDQWNHDGTLQKILDRLRGQVEIDHALWCVDGTIIRAHKCATGGGKKTTQRNHRITQSVAVEAV